MELGRVDTNTEASVLSSHLALPREDHQEAVHYLFGYLSIHHNSRMVCDPTVPKVDQSKFNGCDWSNFYGDVKEAVPEDAPVPRGEPVTIRMFIVSSRADEAKTGKAQAQSSNSHQFSSYHLLFQEASNSGDQCL